MRCISVFASFNLKFGDSLSDLCCLSLYWCSGGGDIVHDYGV